MFCLAEIILCHISVPAKLKLVALGAFVLWKCQQSKAKTVLQMYFIISVTLKRCIFVFKL